jgi:N-acetylmuramoyl-L-alanine amidase
MTINVRQKLATPSKYSIKCPYEMEAEFIIWHNTANDASADAEINYMINNNNEVSFHFAADDKEVVQGIPLNRNSWNAGDGGKGSGNRKGISLEVCYSKSGGDRYNKAEALAIKFTAQLLKERKWGIDKVKKHQDFSNKNCPHRILSEGRWQQVLNAINAELQKLNAPTPQTNKDIHIIQLGDTLWAISKKYNMSVAELKKLNNLISDVIHVGDQLKLNSHAKVEVKPTSPKVNPVKQVVHKIVKPKAKSVSGKLVYTRTLRKGSKGNDVKALQNALNKLNFKCGVADGDFGNKTEDSVRRIQMVYLPREVDGIAGRNTINKINSLLK